MPLQPPIEPGTLIRTLSGRIIFWSEELHRRYGFSAEEAIGQDSHALLRTSQLQTRDQIDAVLALRSEWQGGLTAYRVDDQPVMVATHWVLHRDADGLETFVTETHADIAESGSPADALADVVATFVGDLSQPLTVLGFLIDLAQRAAPNRGPMDRCLSDATAQLDRANAIIARFCAIAETMRDPRLAAPHAGLPTALAGTEPDAASDVECFDDVGRVG